MSVISSIILYLAVVSISCFFLKYLVGQGHTELACGSFQKSICINSNYKVIITCLICILPVVLLYTLRFGIGYDYLSYEKSYHILHNTAILEYFRAHRGAVHGTFYVEPGYYLLNRIAPNYHILQFLNALVIFLPFSKAVCICRTKISPHVAFFVFYATQFIYSMNGVRYSMALSFILLAFVYLLHHKNLKFFICIAVAAMFHTTALLALLYFLVREFRSPLLNRIRDMVLILLPFSIPYAKDIFQTIGAYIPAFHRLYALYPMTNEFHLTWGLWLHFVPPVLPALLIFGKKMFESQEERTMFRILLTEIPIRLFSIYNGWYGRLCRIPQLIYVIFVPYMLRKVKQKEERKILLLYYVLWYTFYFLYYHLALDGSSIHYQWIF